MTLPPSTLLMQRVGCRPTRARPLQPASLRPPPPLTCWRPTGLGPSCFASATRVRARSRVARGNRPPIAAFRRPWRLDYAPLTGALVTPYGSPASGLTASCRGASGRRPSPPMAAATGTGGASHRPSLPSAQLRRPRLPGGLMQQTETAPSAWTPWLARGRHLTPRRARRLDGGRATMLCAATATRARNTVRTTGVRCVAQRGASVWLPEGALPAYTCSYRYVTATTARLARAVPGPAAVGSAAVGFVARIGGLR